MGRTVTATASTALAAMLAASLGMSTAAAAGGRIAARDWHRVKCTRYREAWSRALARTGQEGLGQEFLARHRAFLDSDCTRQSDVCPSSRQELAIANTMVVVSMNFGAASTFAPFYCR